MSVNFAFMKAINPSYYELLDSIEKDARIRPEQATQNCRKLLEVFIQDVFAANRIPLQKELYKNLGLIKNNQSLNIPIVPRIEYDVVDSQNRISKKKNHGLYYIKDLGNAGSHVGKGEDGTMVLITPHAVIEALRIYHDFFTAYYGDRLQNTKPEFLEKNVPVGEYEIKQSYVPADSERSRCIMEYRCERRAGEYSKSILYALVREYIPGETDRLFLTRNIDAFSEAYHYTYTNGVTVKKLNNTNELFANFFIAYEFVKPFVTLSNFLKKNKISMKDRITICLRIAESLSKFHTAADPIYHRMLTYECIMISDFRDTGDGYRPYITKFDFAKITRITEGTVYKNLSDAEARESLKLSRYRIDALSPDSKWDKVDIYSLGVLFIDIMLGDVSIKSITEKTFEALAEAGISDAMIDTIDEMLYDTPDDRPDINRVLEAITAESRLHA